MNPQWLESRSRTYARADSHGRCGERFRVCQPATTHNRRTTRSATSAQPCRRMASWRPRQREREQQQSSHAVPRRAKRAARVSSYHVRMELATPLILVDVDGVLNPHEPAADGYRRHWVFPHGIPHRLALHPMHGRMLSDLAEATNAELVWASYWQNRANTWIAPRIGLPSIRNVPIPSRSRLRARSSLGEWKAAHVAAWIGPTPFVWFEDEPDVPGSLVQQPSLGPHLVITVNPATGLTQPHIERARVWLKEAARTK